MPRSRIDSSSVKLYTAAELAHFEEIDIGRLHCKARVQEIAAEMITQLMAELHPQTRGADFVQITPQALFLFSGQRHIKTLPFDDRVAPIAQRYFKRINAQYNACLAHHSRHRAKRHHEQTDLLPTRTVPSLELDPEHVIEEDHTPQLGHSERAVLAPPSKRELPGRDPRVHSGHLNVDAARTPLDNDSTQSPSSEDSLSHNPLPRVYPSDLALRWLLDIPLETREMGCVPADSMSPSAFERQLMPLLATLSAQIKELNDRIKNLSPGSAQQSALSFPDAATPNRTLLTTLSSPLYTNNLENREFGKEAPQIFCPARVTVFIDMTRARDKKYGAKPTLPKTDFPGYLCIQILSTSLTRQKVDLEDSAVSQSILEMAARAQPIHNLLADLSRRREVAELGIALTHLRKLAFQAIRPLNRQEDHTSVHEILRSNRVVVQKLYRDNPDEAVALIHSVPPSPTDSPPLLDAPKHRADEKLEQSPVRKRPERLVQSPESVFKSNSTRFSSPYTTINTQIPRTTPIPKMNSRVSLPPLSPRRQKSPPGNPFDENF